ncbi:nucleoid-associated protein [Enterobacter mori]
MSFLNDHEIDALSIKRMIFHIVGGELEVPVLLSEITPPEHVDFFLERIKSALTGNMFSFTEFSNTERILRLIHNEKGSGPGRFTEQSTFLASDFQSHHHTKNTSMGVFFLFELSTVNDDKLFALIKYDNEDVVRYVLNEEETEFRVPKLERFRESFVKKPEAMQKIALVRLNNDTPGGHVMVRDRSKRTHISVYFERFLQVKRTNSTPDLCEKLVNALKDVLKKNREILPDDVKRSGVNKIYETLRLKELDFNTDEPLPLLTSIFGPLEEDHPVVKSFARKVRDLGIAGESFRIQPQEIQKPRKRKLETLEDVIIIYDEENTPVIEDTADGRKRIVIITAGLVTDDVDTGKNRQSH